MYIGRGLACTLLQYHYLMSRFMYRFWVVKRGPVCLMGQHCVAFKKENSPIHLRGLAAPVIWKVRVLWYEFTDVTLAWEDGQWVEAHKIILAGCSPKKAPQPSCLSWMVLILMSRKQKRKRQTGPPSGCPKLVLWLRQLKRGARSVLSTSFRVSHIFLLGWHVCCGVASLRRKLDFHRHQW